MRQKVLQSYPYPVAHPYSVVFDENHTPQTRVWALHFTTYQALKVSCLPVVSQYLTDPKETEAMERKAVDSLNRAIAGIRCPFFNDWITLLGTLAKRMPQVGIEPCFPLSVALDKLKQRVQPFSDEYALRGQKDANLLEAMLGLRNGLAHGASLPPDERCLQLLTHYAPVLDNIMDAFDFLERCEIRVLEQEDLSPLDDEAKVRRLVGAHRLGLKSQLPEPETITLSDAWRDAFEESPMAMAIEGGQVLPLYPLFFRGISEPCAQYDGHYVMRTMKPATAGGLESVEEAYIYYLGVWEKFQDESAFEALRQRLERRKVTWWIEKKDAAPWTLADSIRDYSYRTYQDLLGVKYFPACYVEREDVMKHFRTFMRIGEADIGQRSAKTQFSQKQRRYPNGFLLIGEAGTGKTAWAAHVAQQLLLEGVVGEVSPDAGVNPATTADREGCNLLFFLRGNGIVARPSGNTLFLNLSEKIGLKAGDFGSFSELLSHLDTKWPEDRIKGRRLVILLDAINEAQPAEQAMREALELIKEASYYPWCKVILTVRWEFLRVLEGKRGFEEVDAFSDVRAYLYQPPRERDEMTFLREREKVPGVVLERLEESEATQIYRNYQQFARSGGGSVPARSELGYAVSASTTPWEELSPQTRNVLTNPLMIHLFHQAFAGRPASSIAGEGALYRAYLDDILRRRPRLEEAAHDVVTRLFSVERSTLTDEDVHKLRERWTEGKSPQETRILLSPVEALEQEGIIRKRVAAEGGGYRFVFQTVLEALAYRNLRRLEGSERPTMEFWLERAQIEPPFPEYGGVFVFLFRELHGRSLYDFMASLVENGLSYVDSALRTFLKELAAEEWTPGSVSEGFQQCAQGVARQGADWTAVALADVGYQLIRTRYVPAAEPALAAALEIIERFYRENPENVEVAKGLALSLTNLVEVYLQSGRAQEAEAACKRAIEIQERIYHTNPENVAVAQDLAGTHINLGIVYAQSGRAQEAEAAYQRAIGIQERIYREKPSNIEVAEELASSLTNLGIILYAQSGRAQEAEAAYQRAIGIQERIYREKPSNIEVAEGLASSLTNLGVRYYQSGRAQKAEGAYKRAIKIREHLYRENQENVKVANRLAWSLTNLGLVYGQSGRAQEAEASFKRAIEIRERLYRENPSNIEVAEGLASSLTNLGIVYAQSGRAQEAEASFKRAIEIRERLYRKNPSNVEVATYLASSLTNLGLVYGQSGRAQEAEAAHKRAIDHQEHLYRENPSNIEVAEGLASSLTNLGKVYLQSGRAQEAERAYKRAIEIRERIYRENPSNVEVASYLASSFTGLGWVYGQSGRAQEAEGAYKRAIEIREQLYREHPEFVEVRWGLADTHRNLGLLLLRDRGDAQGAIAAFSRYMELEDRKSEQKYVDSARQVIGELQSRKQSVRGFWRKLLQRGSHSG
jgi:tetratricopeptide (TPR) repeat protein